MEHLLSDEEIADAAYERNEAFEEWSSFAFTRKRNADRAIAKAQYKKCEPLIIQALLSAIEEHGLNKVLALRDKKRKPFNLADLSDPREIRGRGTGV